MQETRPLFSSESEISLSEPCNPTALRITGLCLLLLGVVFSPASLFAGPASQNESNGVNQPDHRPKPYVILISIDGMRADYLDRPDLPNLQRMRRQGARAQGLIPVFPSVTFPNHYSIVTGLYPDRHGIVGNEFFDPQRNETFVGDRDGIRGNWYRGEPIWLTAERQGMVTACLFWVGCSADIQGRRPTYWTTYNVELPVEKRIDTVLSWLQLPEESRPHFIALYLTSHVDDVGHWYGPDPIEVNHVLQAVDGQLGYLLDRLQALPHHEQISLMVVSDHGMAEVRPEHAIRPDKQLDSNGLRTVLSGSHANLHITDGVTHPTALRDGINQWLRHGHAYVRSEMPEHLHHRADPRVGDVIIVMDQPYTLSRQIDEEPWGHHGWDPSHPAMHGIFMAMGPGVKPGAVIPPFENVHIYSLLAELLNLNAVDGVDSRPGWLKQAITQ